MRVYLIRHGESIANKEERFYEEIPSVDIQLTNDGLMQANDAGLAMKKILDDNNINVNKVLLYHSPFRRAKDTCGIIKTCTNIPKENMLEDDLLAERSYGEYSDIPKEIRDEWRKQKRASIRGVEDFYTRSVGGESALDAEIRIRLFFETMYRDAIERKAEAVILVCHGTLITTLLKWYLHKDLEWYNKFEQESFPENGSIHLIEDGKYIGEIFKPSIKEDNDENKNDNTYKGQLVTLNKNGVNYKIKVNILSDEEMKEIGFTEYRKGYLHFSRAIQFPNKKKYKNFEVTFGITIPRDGSDIRIDVLDEAFCQPYDYQHMLEKNPNFEPAIIVNEQVEKWMKYLEEKGVLTGHIYGEYI